MKKSSILFMLLFGVMVNAQHSISGTFTPAKDYKWLIAYHLKSGNQAYTVDTAIKNGAFTLNFPAEAEPGTYRLVYAVPEEDFYFDVLYNGKEDVQLKFDSEKGVSFTASKENRIFDAYFKEINAAKQAFIDFYQSEKADKDAFSKLTHRLQSAQNGYEDASEDLLAHHFIAANRPYIPSGYETGKMYWQHKKDRYFEHLDLNDAVLQSSAFLTDKLGNYVFTAVSTEKKSKAETQKVLQENIDKVASELKGTDAAYRFHIFHTFYTKATANEFYATADHILDTYLKPLAEETGNQKTVDDIEVQSRLQIGAIPPEITWLDGSTTKTLSEMAGADCYILIFWSSTCSHCLHEIPPLHEKLKQYPDTQVIAVGLEDGKENWEKESAKLPDFVHVLALDHWDSEYAKIYDIHKTPTFFILDADKRIIAKPESDKEVVKYLEGKT